MAQNPLPRLSAAIVMPSRFNNKPYVHQDFPRAFYHEDGRTVVAQSAEEAKEKYPEADGWSRKPFPPKPAVAPVPEPTIKELTATVTAQAAVITDLQTWAVQISEEVLALKEAKQHGKKPTPVGDQGKSA